VWKTRLTVRIFALAVTANGEEPRLTRDPFTGISALAVRCILLKLNLVLLRPKYRQASAAIPKYLPTR